MSPVSVATLAVAVAALYSAGLHGWLHWSYRRGRIHLWHSVTSLAVCGLAGSIFLLYESAGLEEAKRWQNWMFVFSAPLLVGYFQFSWEFLALSGRWQRWLVGTFGVAIGLVAGTTDLFLEHQRFRTSIPSVGLDFVYAPLSDLGNLAVVGFGITVLYLASLFVRYARKDDIEFRVIAAATALLCAAGAVDLAKSWQWITAPYVAPFGYLALVAGSSGILLRRFVKSMVYAEALAGNLHDLVERRTAEIRQKDIQLAHGERMAVVGTLAAGIAHEVNNPMAFLSSNLNRLEELWTKPDSAGEAMEILGECQEGADRVRSTVAELLSLSRRDESNLEPVDLTDVVASVLRMVRYEARERALIVKDLATCAPFPGDRRLVAQVVLNLVMNALQAIGEGRPDENRVLVRTRDLGDRIELRVEDTGPGIPEPFRTEIFDPFFTTKRAGEGTGLGLAVTRKIVREHRGDIRVESSNLGTRMIVEFPVGERGGDAPAEASA